MPKTYPEELAEWVKGREAKKPRQDKHVVAFLAVKSDVQAALDAGYAMKTIWEHMKETDRLPRRRRAGRSRAAWCRRRPARPPARQR